LNIFRATEKSLQYSSHPARSRLSSEDVCNGCAAHTIFCQSQDFRLKKSKKKPAFDFQKMPSALKKREFQNLASEKRIWQP